MSGTADNYGPGNEWDYVPDTEPGQAERDYDQQEIAAVRAEMEAEQQAEYEAEQRGEFGQQTEADAVAAHDAEYEELIERYESGQPARSDLEQAEYNHLAACADEPEEDDVRASAGKLDPSAQTTAVRLAELADQISAGHIPAGVRACGPGGRVISGPAEMPDPEAGA